MKSNEKRMILILLVILIIAIALFVAKNKKTNKVPEKVSQEVIQSQNGTNQNTNEKQFETKIFGDIEISGIKMVEKSGVATLTATVKNNSAITKKEFPIKIKLLNDSGKVVQELGAYVGTMKSGESRGINASINMSISQINDISIEL